MKKITITKEAYDALNALRGDRETFSDVILRIAKRRPSLQEFAGILSEESGDELERIIKENRRKHAITRKARMERIIKALDEP